jgi:hypothetical protein
MKRAMDRASGSGVFARDPDAQLDMIELELNENARGEANERGISAWRLESSLREFRNISPVEFWFDYPIHRLDLREQLQDAPAKGSMEAARLKSPKYTTPEQRAESVRMAYLSCSITGEDVTLKEMAQYMGVSERCARDRVRVLSDEFVLEKGIVKPASEVSS